MANISIMLSVSELSNQPGESTSLEVTRSVEDTLTTCSEGRAACSHRNKKKIVDLKVNFDLSLPESIIFRLLRRG